MRAVRIVFGLLFTTVALLTVFMVQWFRERYGRGGPFPASQARALLNPLRRFVHPARASLQQFRVGLGDTVLELGPGPGYFTVEASRMVGASGRIVCLDMQRPMVVMLRDRLAKHRIVNAHPVVGDATRLPLADHSVDVAFLVTVLGEIADRPRALAELRRVLKPGGVLALMEALTDPDYVLVDTARDLCRASGFDVLDHRPQRLGYIMTFAAPRGG